MGGVKRVSVQACTLQHHITNQTMSMIDLCYQQNKVCPLSLLRTFTLSHLFHGHQYKYCRRSHSSSTSQFYFFCPPTLSYSSHNGLRLTPFEQQECLSSSRCQCPQQERCRFHRPPHLVRETSRRTYRR